MTKTAYRRRSGSTFRGGLEGTLDGAALAFFVLGCLAAIAAAPTFKFAGLFVAVGIFACSEQVWLLLRALAELIRIQKKTAGLPYGGKISEAQEQVAYV